MIGRRNLQGYLKVNTRNSVSVQTLWGAGKGMAHMLPVPSVQGRGTTSVLQCHLHNVKSTKCFWQNTEDKAKKGDVQRGAFTWSGNRQGQVWPRATGHGPQFYTQNHVTLWASVFSPKQMTFIFLIHAIVTPEIRYGKCIQNLPLVQYLRKLLVVCGQVS